MTLQTRPPTGRPAWPILLLAGVEKSGKSWACAQASGSAMVGRTLWVSIGEDDPDEYGLVPGARFEIVQHDGTYRGILAALRAVVAEPHSDVPNLLVVDSMTRLWDLITGQAQDAANRRAARKNRGGDGDVQITMDLWNAAKDRWTDVVDVIRSHRGPSLLTARLDVVTVVDDAGQPTKEKTTKVKAEKTLPYDVTGIVEMPARGEAWLTGMRSARMQLAERTRVPAFTAEELWRALGLDDAQERQHAAVVVESDDPGEARAALGEWMQAEGIDLQEAVDRWAVEHDNEHLKDAVDGAAIRAMHAAWRDERTAQQTGEAR